MTLRVLRLDADDHRTIGALFIDGIFTCYSLEDRVRPAHQPKVPGATAIPSGIYPVTITESVRFGRKLPLLQNVPGFSGIRLHPGNTDADTAGCILLGMHRSSDAVLESVSACALVQKRIADALKDQQTVYLSLEDCF